MKQLRFVQISLSLVLAMSMVFVVQAVSEHSEAINREQWPSYENGPNILALKQVSTILEKYQEHDKVSLEIRYPGGDAGRAWAESLSSWFVAFGIPKQQQELLPGSGAPDWIVIALIDRR